MEELNVDGLLKKLDALDVPIERLILSSDGTVITLLSILFRTRIKVEVIAQSEYHGMILRKVKMLKGQEIVAEAFSLIPKEKNAPELVKGILQCEKGLGQLLKDLNINYERWITHVNRDKAKFWRGYRIIGEGVDMFIVEEFPIEKYQDI